MPFDRAERINHGRREELWLPTKSFSEAASGYGEEKEGHDLLTDPHAVTAAKEKAEDEKAISHGQKLRAAREKRGFSIEEVAAQTGYRSRCSGPTGSRRNIPAAGPVDQTEQGAFAEDVGCDFHRRRSVHHSKSRRAPQLQPFRKSKTGQPRLRIRILGTGQKGPDDGAVHRHTSSGGRDEPSSHDGQEFIYVLDGEMEVLVDDTRDVLKPGDAIYYDSTSMHLVKAHGDKPAKILAVLVS